MGHARLGHPALTFRKALAQVLHRNLTRAEPQRRRPIFGAQTGLEGQQGSPRFGTQVRPIMFSGIAFLAAPFLRVPCQPAKEQGSCWDFKMRPGGWTSLGLSHMCATASSKDSMRCTSALIASWTSHSYRETIDPN